MLMLSWLVKAAFDASSLWCLWTPDESHLVIVRVGISYINLS